MPTPKKGEARKDFVSRCVPIVIREGTARDGSQGAAICNSMWRQHQKKQRGEAFDLGGDQYASDGYLLDAFESFDDWASYEAQNRRPSTRTQTLIFSKDTYPTRESAKAWAREHGFKDDTVRETTQSWRLRQEPVGSFQSGSFRVISLRRGVQAVIGRPRAGG